MRCRRPRRWLFFLTLRRPPRPTLFPYTTLFRSDPHRGHHHAVPRRATVQHVAREHGHHHRSEEHTSELQSPDHLVCRLLLEKKNMPLAPTHARPGVRCQSEGPATSPQPPPTLLR